MDHIKKLIQCMTLSEKIDLLVGDGPWHTAGIPRLGIRALRLTDGPSGVRYENSDAPATDRHNRHGSYCATCFPTLALLASTFDRRAAWKMGERLGEEAAHYGVDILLGPGINHKRTPIGGRNFEYLSEDPFLTSEIAVSYIRGVQSRGVGCSLKHYFGNNTEYNRHEVDVCIDERALREIYLRSFERVIAAARPFTVMAAYNRFHGQYCAQSREVLEDYLRRELGFDGAVVSDWGAVHDRVAALQAGCDLEMGFDYGDSKARLLRAAESGEVSETLIDTSCERLLALQEKCNARKGEAVDFEEGYRIALEIALGGMVLLKNDGVLPLRSSDFCVIGDAAVTPRYQGEGSSRVESFRVSSPYEQLCKQYGSVPYARGYARNLPYDEELVRQAKRVAAASGTALIFLDCDDYAEEESSDRATLSLPQKHLRLIDAVTQVCGRVVVLLQTGGVTEMPYCDRVQGIVQMYFAGEAAGEAVALLLSGKRNFSGRLAETFPVRYEDNPAWPYYAKEPDRLVYGEGIRTGYRYYDGGKVAPRFAFGYGLSYTSFSYSRMTCRREGDGVVCRVYVRNTGGCDGAETVMLFVGKPFAGSPVRELVGFDKVEIPAGEERCVRIRVALADLAVWDERVHAFVIPQGEYRFSFCDGSARVAARADCEIISGYCGREEQLGRSAAVPAAGIE